MGRSNWYVWQLSGLVGLQGIDYQSLFKGPGNEKQGNAELSRAMHN